MSHRKSLSDAEREQRRIQQRQLVTASVKQLQTSGGWQAYLRARRTFRSYSVGNVLLILHQHPTATRVAGFRAWLKLGYAVRKGETAIRIWAPCPPTARQLHDWQTAGADPQERPRTRWRLAAVFAQDQVAPLPAPAQPAPLEPPSMAIAGASHSDLIAPLIELASEIDYTVNFQTLVTADGYCRPTDRQIVIAERLSANARVATLIHELGHALLRAQPEASELTYAEEELIVESIAVSACELVGLDTQANSIPYLAFWAEQADLPVLERAAHLSDRIARRIEDQLLAPTSPATPQTATPPTAIAA